MHAKILMAALAVFGLATAAMATAGIGLAVGLSVGGWGTSTAWTPPPNLDTGGARYEGAAPDPGGPSLTINGRTPSPDEVRRMIRAFGAVVPGHYWYDATSGLYGRMGQGAAGVIGAGPAYGQLSADASGGTTGVFLNGRELPFDEHRLYSAALGGVGPGRYWLDASGNVGYEGAPVATDNMFRRLGGGSPADPWLTGDEWSGEARVGGASGTRDRSGGGNDVFAIDGEVLDLPF